MTGRHARASRRSARRWCTSTTKFRYDHAPPDRTCASRSSIASSRTLYAAAPPSSISGAHEMARAACATRQSSLAVRANYLQSQLRRRHLEHIGVLQGRHTMTQAGRDMKRLTRTYLLRAGLRTLGEEFGTRASPRGP